MGKGVSLGEGCVQSVRTGGILSERTHNLGFVPPQALQLQACVQLRLRLRLGILCGVAAPDGPLAHRAFPYLPPLSNQTEARCSLGVLRLSGMHAW